MSGNDDVNLKPLSRNIPQHIIDQAAEWLVTLTERPLSTAEQMDLEHWRQRSPDHEYAWQTALQFKTHLHELPASISKHVFERRRTVLKSFIGAALLLPVAGKLGWDHWPALTADHKTAKGEQRTIQLADGSELQLNTATIADVRFAKTQRLISLVQGEIRIKTAPDNHLPARPFIVSTNAGQIRALGTHFSVRTTGDQHTQVTVYQDAVSVTPALSNSATRVDAGSVMAFDRHKSESSKKHQDAAPAWANGLIVSDNQRLDDFLSELSRYRAGILRCDPNVASLRISGVFQITDTNQTLSLLADTLPVRINKTTEYWVTVSRK